MIKHRGYYIPKKDDKEYRKACEEYVERHGLKVNSRAFDLVIQRQVIAYLMRNKGCGLYSIGYTIGKDHSNVAYSVKKVNDLKNIGDKETIKAIELIGKEIEEIINNKNKEDMYQSDYYPAMTSSQLNDAPWNQREQRKVDFECEAYYSVKVNQTISTNEYEINNHDEYELNSKNDSSLDVTPQSFVKFAIDLIKQRMKEETNQRKIQEFEKKLQFAESLEIELDEFASTPLDRPNFEPEPEYEFEND